jgi:hypothetical protein
VGAGLAGACDIGPARFAKALVRDNPAFPRKRREQQLRMLREVSDAVRGLGVPLLDELLVPVTGGQLAAAGGMQDACDRDLRPALVMQVIAGNQAARAEPGSGRSRAWRQPAPRGQ